MFQGGAEATSWPSRAVAGGKGETEVNFVVVVEIPIIKVCSMGVASNTKECMLR